MADEAGYRAVGEFDGWALRDPLGRRIGRVSRVFVDREGWPAHVEVSLGLFGRKIVLLPVEHVVMDREGRAIALGKGPRRPGL